MAKQQTKTSNNYSTFYLVMLILTTVNFVFHIPSFFDIPNLLKTFSDLPLFVVLSLLDIIITIVGVVALVYLYQKQRLGYWMILGYVALQLIITPLLLLNLGQVLDYYALLNPTEKLTDEEMVVYSGIMYGVFYVVIAFGMIFYAAMGTLWHFAWKKQHAADHIKSAKK